MADRVSHAPVRDRLIIAAGVVVGFSSGIMRSLIDEGEPPSAIVLIIGVVVYSLIAASIALNPDNVIDRAIGAAVMSVAALWAVIGGTLLPYALGVTDISIQEFGRRMNDDVEWWWVFAEWAIGSLIGGAFIGFLCGLVAHVGILLVRRFGFRAKGVG